MSRVIDLGEAPTPEDVAALAAGEAQAALGAAARARIAEATAALDARIAEGRRIYGVTTGYGPLADRWVDAADAPDLQRGLVYHLATGVGPPLPRATVRATIAARLANLAQGWSAVSPAVLDTWLGLLNADLCPVVPERGTVGASGDLTPLAHIALASMGEGRIWDAGGVEKPAAEALAAAGLAPVRLGRRDGLALVNGTAAMAGQACRNDRSAARALETGLQLVAAYGEVLGCPSDGLDPRLGTARGGHPGQGWAHARLGELLADSQRIAAAPAPVPGAAPPGEPVGPLPQAAYSFRCAPQEFGAARDAWAFHHSTTAAEVTSAADNPIVDRSTGEVLHGGNFYGQPVAYASDLLANVAVKLATVSERRLARLCEPTRNGGLPPFLTGGTVGLDSGLMGAQVSASALLAEMRTQAVPAAGQSVSTNNANQDVVTLGTVAARRAGDQLDWLWQIMAIEAVALAQAMELIGPAHFGGCAQALHARVRDVSAPLGRDRPLAAELSAVAAQLAAVAAAPSGR